MLPAGHHCFFSIDMPLLSYSVSWGATYLHYQKREIFVFPAENMEALVCIKGNLKTRSNFIVLLTNYNIRVKYFLLLYMAAEPTQEYLTPEFKWCIYSPLPWERLHTQTCAFLIHHKKFFSPKHTV